MSPQEQELFAQLNAIGDEKVARFQALAEAIADDAAAVPAKDVAKSLAACGRTPADLVGEIGRVKEGRRLAAIVADGEAAAAELPPLADEAKRHDAALARATAAHASASSAVRAKQQALAKRVGLGRQAQAELAKLQREGKADA